MRLSVPGALLAVAVLIRGLGFAYESGVAQLAWILAGLACLGSLRLGATAVAVLAWWTVFTDYYNHVLFIAWMSTTFAIFDDREQQRLVVRAQLSIVYGFAALSKINPIWLSGQALASHTSSVPEELLVPTSVLGILSEGFLAAALWVRRLRPLVVIVGAVMHLGFIVVIGDRFFTEWGLLPFNLLAFGLLVWSTGPASAQRTSPSMHLRRGTDAP